MKELREIRRSYSAAKARMYFEEHGRGLLITKIASTPFDAGLGKNVKNVESHSYLNQYWTLANLKEHGAPKYVIELVETYDPDREVVVAIEYHPGHDPEPEIVSLPGPSIAFPRST